MVDKVFSSLDLQSSQCCHYRTLKQKAPIFFESENFYSVMGGGNSITGAFFGEGTTVLAVEPEVNKIRLDPVLGQVSISSAVSVGEAQSYLASRGFMLTSVPSYPGATIGGCIAGNVHGQNHYKEGCFGEGVIELVLSHPDIGVLTVSREKNSPFFDLTVGGFGLTGVILSAVLRVTEINSADVELRVEFFDSIAHGYEKLVAAQEHADFFHSWIDLTNQSPRKENGFFYSALFSANRHSSSRPAVFNPKAAAHFKWRAPLFTPLTLGLINQCYLGKNRKFPQKTQSVRNFIFPSEGRLWYFNMFGKSGIIEHQVLIPASEVDPYLRRLKAILLDKRPFVSLCHIKNFSRSRRLLNFDGHGLCLAIHFKVGQAALEVLDLVDKLNCELNCITNILKDSRVPRWAIKEQYADYEKFVSRLFELDPRRRFRNTLSQRLIDEV